MGRFAPPISAVVDDDGKIAVSFGGGESVGDVILHDSHRGQAAFQVLRDHVMVEPPVAGQAPTLELERMLEENGLFSQEAPP